MGYTINVEDEKVKEHIDKIHEKGGVCYVVGGYVRDIIIGRYSKDIDIEVHTMEFDDLKEIFGEDGKVQANFGVLILKDTLAEFAIPRKENKIGIKHIDFEINLDPNMSLKDAAYRRDFTINSIMYNLKTKEIIDNYNGLGDLDNKIIRHVGEKFSEDPLRVLRAVRFSFELGFEIHKDTKNLCLSMLGDLKFITPSRKNQEISKMFNVNYDNFKIGMQSFETILLKYFDLEDLCKTEQRALYHPEGNVWEHTKQAMYNVNLNKDKYNAKDYKILMLSMFLHDIGKIDTTDANLSAHGHEKRSVELAQDILSDILINKEEKKLILNLIEDHMKMHLIYEMKSFKLLKLVEKYKENIGLLIEVGAIDLSSRLEVYDEKLLLEKYKFCKDKYIFLETLYEKVQEKKKVYNGHYFIEQGYSGEQIKVQQQDCLIKFVKKYRKEYIGNRSE